MCEKQRQACTFYKVFLLQQDGFYRAWCTETYTAKLYIITGIPDWALHFKSPAYKTNFAEDVCATQKVQQARYTSHSYLCILFSRFPLNTSQNLISASVTVVICPYVNVAIRSAPTYLLPTSLPQMYVSKSVTKVTTLVNIWHTRQSNTNRSGQSKGYHIYCRPINLPRYYILSQGSKCNTLLNARSRGHL
jgi:hypothetical protein